MPSATRSGGRVPVGRSPGTATGRHRIATTARGSNATPRRGRNATTARGGRSPPAINERVTLASLAALVGELQAAQAATSDELRAALTATREEVAAEKGAVGMCHQLQNELDDVPRSDNDDHIEPATPVRRVEEKAHYAAWLNLSVRKVWITVGEKPAVYNLKRSEMQALLADVALASDATTLQLNTFTGFRVASYMNEGDNHQLAANMFLPEQMEIMVEALLAVVGNGVTSEDGVDRLSILEGGLREGLASLRDHCRKYRGKPACRRTRH